VFEMGDRTAIPPYDYDHMRVGQRNDMPPIVRASWLARACPALPNTFAHESYIDEIGAMRRGVDPIAYRLRYLKDQARAIDLVNAVAERARLANRGRRDRKRSPRTTSYAGPRLRLRAFMCTANFRAMGAALVGPGSPDVAVQQRRPATSA